MAVVLSEFKITWAVLVVGFLLVLSLIPILIYSRVNLSFFFLCVYASVLPLDISKAFIFQMGSEQVIKYLSPYDVASFIMIIFWLSDLFGSGSPKKIYFSGILLPFLFFVLWSELSMINAVKPHLTLTYATSYFKWFMVFTAISNILTTRKQFEIMLLFLMMGILFQGVYVFFQHKYNAFLFLEGLKATGLGRGLSYGTGYQQVLRPSGTFHHPNVLASFMVHTLPILFALLLAKRHFLLKMPLALALGSGFFALLLSYSRGGWVGFALAIAIILVVATLKKMIQAKTLLLIVLTAAIAVAASFPLWRPFTERLIRPDDSATTSRWVMLEQAYMMVKTHPLLGIGLNNYAERGKDFIPDDANLILRFAPKGIAHNRYAVIMAETGFIGLGLFIWLLWAVALQACRNISIEDSYFQLLALGLFASLMGVYLAMMFDHFSDSTRNILFWFFSALIAAIGNISRQKKTV